MLLRQQKLEGTRFLRKGKTKQNKTENEVTWDKVLKKRKKKNKQTRNEVAFGLVFSLKEPAKI